ncbi:glutamate-5-semialdehyde dehydrogenase [Acuticoccus sp. MNP-M23]|uniref:glutamate-5-semialdehyde dehydrogenase n=1 Tax=Acuticoccus sp. MNP-M23 TaxID=3072793 RepID=UPI002815A1F7|nr:glutamate-5-semialdehyde dehydrogenase [Acuticoccus sp. MNP-M23]WMS45139.1 glutamate-5-semialdehyde dehydrogenase [Acuticoccus sp. MNP-M23]
MAPTEGSAAEMVAVMGARARAAQTTLALASGDQKRAALVAMAAAVRSAAPDILSANFADLSEMDPNPAFRDRAKLDDARIEAIAGSLEAIADLPDPVGRMLASWDRPNGLRIERVSTPLGVIGVIYESRPNVTADAAALCVMAGNAVILRSGSETVRSARAIAAAIRAGLDAAGLPQDAVQLVPTRDRAAVGAMLAGADGTIDVIVPRGGRGLVLRMQREARIPVFAHLEGLCHVFLHGAAEPQMALDVVLNAKMRRTGICGSAETLLIDTAFLPHAVPVLEALQDAGCELRGDRSIRDVLPMAEATTQDFATEYLAPIISVAVVDGLDGALAHIAQYSSNHTDGIVTADPEAAARFLNEVDSAIVVHNASTQFADGGEFGMGAEIGIATGRFHARGPVGLEQLTTFKYRVHGEGQTRP